MNSTLRVAVIASSRFPICQPFAGGLEAHVWHLVRGLTARGHRVSVFAAPGSDRELGCHTLAVRPLAVSNIAESDESMPSAAFMTEHHAYLALMLELARDDFDIVHNHSLHYLPVAMASMLCTPMLTTLHTPPTPWLESAVQASDGLGTHVAAVSRHTAAAWGHAIRDITVVPNGIEIGRWPLGPGGDYLVWFGRMTAQKAPHLAISAARRAGRPLVLAGPISDSSYFYGEVAPQLGHGISYAGHLKQDRLADLIGGAAAALVTPTWDEPYGLVVAEAMCCGTPVVAFARGGVPELIGPRSGRLVPPGDHVAMADAISEAVQLSRTHVRDHAVRQCSSEAMLTSYLDLYRDIIDSHSEANHDRLLRSPSRLWPSGPCDEYLRAVDPPVDRVDIARHPHPAPVRCRGEATA